jgi:hypothetical protein
MVKWALGATGLGAVSAAFFLPHPYGIIVAITILLFALLLFGGYFLWRRRRARREREQFSSAVEAQTAATPKAISDPNRRADLDRVRQKFQTGLQEYKKRGKDLYKLPWYVIIGESGSGKTEAIRHSGIDFPPGLQDELQGSGGTVNMDWWFTNRGIILDTAGSMLFNEARAGEAPEWREFLRLLKRARPQCPVNGLFLVLSVESLIRDSADKIAQKASRLAQQLDIIQRALDVRFPVYLVVTKCDLLAGFREFFDSIDDPLLQHQMFGWSNPDPLDTAFRPDLVEQHLGSVAARLRRRRMALIRDTSGTGRLGDTQQFFAANYQLGRGPTATPRRLDEVDSLFALPESVMRLAPRLRRYLETVFVAGEWSAKPVFLRGIYFTSSMREGKALDEAIALATGLALDQLPEDRSLDKGRAFFLRDLFHEKVFRESGLVTRATNTLQLLRRRQLAIFGSAVVALLLLLVFSGLAYRSLKRSVLAEAAYWKLGAAGLTNGIWSPAIVSEAQGFRFAYGGTNRVPGADGMSVIEYERKLREIVEKPLAISWIFKPIAWMNAGSVQQRSTAQRILFERSVLIPLVDNTRRKMRSVAPSLSSISPHREALLSLMELEADSLMTRANGGVLADPSAATKCLCSFLSYLTEEDFKPDTNLVSVFVWTYSKDALKKSDGVWPPKSILGGNTLASNSAIRTGLDNFQAASLAAQRSIDQHLKLVNDLADNLNAYHLQEWAWLTNVPDCSALNQKFGRAKAEVDSNWKALEAATNFPAGPLTNLAARYAEMAAAARRASASVFSAPINTILIHLPSDQSGGLFNEIKKYVDSLAGQAADPVLKSYTERKPFVPNLDALCLAPPTNSSLPSFQVRWSLYTNACDIASHPTDADDSDIGNQWTRFGGLKEKADRFQTKLTLYAGPSAPEVTRACGRIAGDSVQRLQQQFVQTYVALTSHKLSELTSTLSWPSSAVSAAGELLDKIGRDLKVGNRLGDQQEKLEPVRVALDAGCGSILKSIDAHLARILRFPVALNASQTDTASQLGDLRKELDSLLGVIEKPVWQGDKSGALDKLRADCKAAADVARSLVTTDGTPTEFALFFVPPTDSSPQNDRDIRQRFRFVDLLSGQNKGAIPDLSKARSDDESSCRLGNGKLALDASLHLSFRQYTDGTGPKADGGVDWDSWGLIRLIERGKAERLDDGTKWRFKVPLTLKEGGTGNMVFEARLDAKQPLPKKEDWPKTR